MYVHECVCELSRCILLHFPTSLYQILALIYFLLISGKRFFELSVHRCYDDRKHFLFTFSTNIHTEISPSIDSIMYYTSVASVPQREWGGGDIHVISSRFMINVFGRPLLSVPNKLFVMTVLCHAMIN